MLPIAYGFRSLLVRRLQSLATLLGVALVVGVFCYLLCFSDGLNHALQITGDPHNLIVLADGATAETNSALSNEDASLEAMAPCIRRCTYAVSATRSWFAVASSTSARRWPVTKLDAITAIARIAVTRLKSPFPSRASSGTWLTRTMPKSGSSQKT